jgi:hypothetical protein
MNMDEVFCRIMRKYTNQFDGAEDAQIRINTRSLNWRKSGVTYEDYTKLCAFFVEEMGEPSSIYFTKGCLKIRWDK